MKKKNNRKSILGLTAFFISLNALGYSPFAYAGGDKIGGGGDILTCNENGKTTYSLLDVYEAKDRGLKLAIDQPGLSMEKQLALAISFYEALDPVRAVKYSLEAQLMLQDIRALDQGLPAPNGKVAYSRIRLADIDDADEVLAPSNCKKDQLVRQDFSKIAIAPYLIDHDLFIDLDDSQKVATLLHEVIYKDFRSYGAQVSKAARYLNGQIFSGAIQKFSQREYMDVLSENLMNNYEFYGVDLFKVGSNVKFDASGNVIQLLGEYPLSFGVSFMNVTIDPEFKNGALVKATTNVNWSEKDGYLKRTEDDRNLGGGTILVNGDGTYTVQNVIKSSDQGFVNFIVDLDGKIISRTETGLYRKGMTTAQDQAFDQLYACLKTHTKIGKQVIASNLEKARTTLAKTDLAALTDLVTECEKQGPKDYSGVVQISPESDQVAAWLMEASLKTRKKTIRECSGFNITAEGSAIIGVGAGITTNLTCTYMDGTRRVYAGVNLEVLTIAIGAEVKVGEVTYEPSKSNRGGWYGGGLFNGPGKGVGPIGGAATLLLKHTDSQGGLPGFSKGHFPLNDDMYVSKGIESKQYRVGLSASSGMTGVDILVRVGKRADDYSHLSSKLLQNLIIQIQ